MEKRAKFDLFLCSNSEVLPEKESSNDSPSAPSFAAQTNEDMLFEKFIDRPIPTSAYLEND